VTRWDHLEEVGDNPDFLAILSAARADIRAVKDDIDDTLGREPALPIRGVSEDFATGPQPHLLVEVGFGRAAGRQ